MMYFEKGSESADLSSQELKECLCCALKTVGDRRKVLLLPPDQTRYHSRAGELTKYAYEYYREKTYAVMPALGTHYAMSDVEIASMFPDVPRSLFRVHDFRKDLVTLGQVPGEYVREVSEGRLDYPWPAQVNKMLVNDNVDLILSIGQVVPHEVIGMANHNKNIFVGVGGAEGISKSHYLGAVYGMERIMGRVDTPVRKVLNYASTKIAPDMPVVYVQTVVGRGEDGRLVVRGLYIGNDDECFRKAADLSLKVNFQMLEKPLKKVVVYLDPAEFKSTWLGNKAIYRTRMALADAGELIILAPGLKEFGEDPQINKLIRKYGYVGSDKVQELVKHNDDLKQNLSAAAHLIHGSTEGRFTVTYCTDTISRSDIEAINFKHAELGQMMQKYDVTRLKDGFNVMKDGEEIFYISNPALGLWSVNSRFR